MFSFDLAAQARFKVIRLMNESSPVANGSFAVLEIFEMPFRWFAVYVALAHLHARASRDRFDEFFQLARSKVALIT